MGSLSLLTREEIEALGGYFDPEETEVFFGPIRAEDRAKLDAVRRRRTIPCVQPFVDSPNKSYQQDTICEDEEENIPQHIHKPTPFSKPTQSRISVASDLSTCVLVEDEEESESCEIPETPKKLSSLRASQNARNTSRMDENDFLPVNNSLSKLDIEHEHSYTVTPCKVGLNVIEDIEVSGTPNRSIIDRSILNTPKSRVKADEDGGYLTVLSEIALVKAAVDESENKSPSDEQVSSDLETGSENYLRENTNSEEGDRISDSEHLEMEKTGNDEIKKALLNDSESSELLDQTEAVIQDSFVLKDDSLLDSSIPTINLLVDETITETDIPLIEVVAASPERVSSSPENIKMQQHTKKFTLVYKSPVKNDDSHLEGKGAIICGSNLNNEIKKVTESEINQITTSELSTISGTEICVEAEKDSGEFKTPAKNEVLNRAKTFNFTNSPLSMAIFESITNLVPDVSKDNAEVNQSFLNETENDLLNSENMVEEENRTLETENIEVLCDEIVVEEKETMEKNTSFTLETENKDVLCEETVVEEKKTTEKNTSFTLETENEDVLCEEIVVGEKETTVKNTSFTLNTENKDVLFDEIVIGEKETVEKITSFTLQIENKDDLCEETVVGEKETVEKNTSFTLQIENKDDLCEKTVVGEKETTEKNTSFTLEAENKDLLCDEIVDVEREMEKDTSITFETGNEDILCEKIVVGEKQTTEKNVNFRPETENKDVLCEEILVNEKETMEVNTSISLVTGNKDLMCEETVVEEKDTMEKNTSFNLETESIDVLCDETMVDEKQKTEVNMTSIVDEENHFGGKQMVVESKVDFSQNVTVFDVEEIMKTNMISIVEKENQLNGTEYIEDQSKVDLPKVEEIKLDVEENIEVIMNEDKVILPSETIAQITKETTENQVNHDLEEFLSVSKEDLTDIVQQKPENPMNNIMQDAQHVIKLLHPHEDSILHIEDSVLDLMEEETKQVNVMEDVEKAINILQSQGNDTLCTSNILEESVFDIDKLESTLPLDSTVKLSMLSRPPRQVHTPSNTYHPCTRASSEKKTPKYLEDTCSSRSRSIQKVLLEVTPVSKHNIQPVEVKTTGKESTKDALEVTNLRRVTRSLQKDLTSRMPKSAVSSKLPMPRSVPKSIGKIPLRTVPVGAVKSLKFGTVTKPTAVDVENMENRDINNISMNTTTLKERSGLQDKPLESRLPRPATSVKKLQEPSIRLQKPVSSISKLKLK